MLPGEQDLAYSPSSSFSILTAVMYMHRTEEERLCELGYSLLYMEDKGSTPTQVTREQRTPHSKPHYPMSCSLKNKSKKYTQRNIYYLSSQCPKRHVERSEGKYQIKRWVKTKCEMTENSHYHGWDKKLSNGRNHIGIELVSFAFFLFVDSSGVFSHFLKIVKYLP